MRLVASLAVLASAATLLAGGASARTAGWKTHRVASADFQIALPETWLDLRRQRQRLLDLIAKEPSLAPYVGALTQSNNLLRFLAGDFETSSLAHGFLTNVNVLSQPAPGTTAAALGTQTAAALRSLPIVVGPVDQTSVRLPAGPSTRLGFTERITVGGRTSTVAVTQYLLVERGSAWVITYSTLPSLRARYAQVFARSAASFRLV